MDVLLQHHVLVLNRLWQAVNICSARRAFCLLYAGHAQVVNVDSGAFQTLNFDQWLEITKGYRGMMLFIR